MKKLWCATVSSWMSSAVLAVITGSLCFSVGEGLRLTPFPVSCLIEDAETDVVRVSDMTSLSQYGPLDVPAQPQQRSKRQALDLACPDPPAARMVVTSFCNLFEFEAVNTVSVLFVPRPEGRAPPSFT